MWQRIRLTLLTDPPRPPLRSGHPSRGGVTKGAKGWVSVYTLNTYFIERPSGISNPRASNLNKRYEETLKKDSQKLNSLLSAAKLQTLPSQSSYLSKVFRIKRYILLAATIIEP